MEPAPLPAKYASAHEPITAILRTGCTAHKALVPDVFDFKGVVHTHGRMVLGNGRPAASLLVLVLVQSNLRHEMEPSRVVPRPSTFCHLSPTHGVLSECFTRPPIITIPNSLESAYHHLVLVLVLD